MTPFSKKRRRGFDTLKEADKKEKIQREERANQLWRFFLSDDDEEIIAFLTSEPIVFKEHNIKEGGRWNNYTCTEDSEEGCIHCDDGSRASMRGGFLIVHFREFERTIYKDGKSTNKKETVPFQIKIFSRGVSDITALDRKNSRIGLVGKEWYATRSGDGANTRYDIDQGDDFEFTEEEVELMISQLPKRFRPHFDIDDEESLMDVLEASIYPDFRFKGEPEDLTELYDSEDDEEEEKPKRRSRMGSRGKSRKKDLDDDVYEDDDDDLDEEDEDEEEVRPKRRKKSVKKRKAVRRK